MAKKKGNKLGAVQPSVDPPTRTMMLAPRIVRIVVEKYQVIPPLIGNPYNGYINPYDHPLLYGNNGSLDPSSYAVMGSLGLPTFTGAW